VPIRAQALHHMTAGPAVWPALARCSALADLYVVLPDAELAERFATLPPSLTRLKASGINALEVCARRTCRPPRPRPPATCWLHHAHVDAASPCSCRNSPRHRCCLLSVRARRTNPL